MKSVLENPSFTVAQVFTTDKIMFLLQMLMPLCFLPFTGKKPARLILLIPMLLINLMTGYSYGYNIFYQYTLGSAAILFYMAVSAYSEMGEKRKKLLLCATLSSIREISQALSVIPADASVAATDSPAGNLTEREELYYIASLEQMKEKVPEDVDYYVVRIGGNWARFEDVIDFLRTKDGVEEIVTEDHIVIFKNMNKEGVSE